uniref:Uncharacterized protein n=1 Tax=Rhipicephalus pulchellus TaxID=72859 RepID=L7LVM1_RHIPC
MTLAWLLRGHDAAFLLYIQWSECRPVWKSPITWRAHSQKGRLALVMPSLKEVRSWAAFFVSLRFSLSFLLSFFLCLCSCLCCLFSSFSFYLFLFVFLFFSCLFLSFYFSLDPTR